MSLRNEAAERTKAGDKFHFSPFDTHKRETPADASPEALAAQTAAYLARGGQITQVASGLTGYDSKTAQKRGVATAAYASSRGHRPKKESQISLKRKIRMEDGL